MVSLLSLLEGIFATAPAFLNLWNVVVVSQRFYASVEIVIDGCSSVAIN